MSVSCHLKEFSWSKSEGSLVDLDDGSLARNDWIDSKENELHLKSHWTEEFKQDAPGGFKTNPFWKELSASNPFLDDIAESCNKEKNNRRISILKEDPELFFRDSNVSENLNDWKALADALQFSDLSRYDLNALQVEKESEKVAYIMKKLKEICHTQRSTRRFLYELSVALLKLDCQGLVARITQDTVIFTAAVKLGKNWRELAEKLARLTKQQIDAYETPHHNKNGEVAPEMMWKPAYDFLYTWSAHHGDSYRDMLQDLHLALDKMKNPVSKQWREITGALILVNCMEVLRASAFSMLDEE